MKNFRMNRKGISPIFATLILIAIAVIAGVVVYMFTSGTLASMTGSTTAAQEKVSVQGVSGTTAAGLTVYAQNQGALAVKITSVMIKDSTGAVVVQATPTGGTPIAGNALGSITTGVITGLSTNTPYTATLVSSQGGSFVSSSFTLTS